MNELTFKQVLPLIKADLAVGLTPALLGEPGIGKSSLIEDLARLNKTKVFTLPVNQLGDKTDLTGMRMTQTKEGSWQQESFPHSIIVDAIEYSKKYPDENPILFLDEFNRASADITSAILSFQTLRKIGDVRFPENLRLIVAGNDSGNITSLDGASVSRFSVYKLIPDLETFLSVQTLNPFITDVLAKHPTDLMAPKLTQLVDEDEESSGNYDEQNLLAGLDMMSDDGFEQITRPRTITYTSDWLNAMGINKSGDDTEKELLGELFTNMSETGEGNVLLAGIEAHAGETTFSTNLFEEIRNHFNAIINSAQTAGQPILLAMRPHQDVINNLSRSGGVPEIEEIISNLSQKELINTLIWLNEGSSVKEINNNAAVKHFMSNAPYSIDKFENDTLKNLISILVEPSKRSDMAIKEMLACDAPIMNQWKAVIKSVIE